MKLNRVAGTCVLTAGMLCLAGVSLAATNVTYSASGTFATPALKGSDQLKLAGLPYSISVVVPEGSKPVKSGTGYAIYKASMYGTMMSGLESGQPIPVGCAPGVVPPNCTPQPAQLELEIASKNDIIKVTSTVKLLNVNLKIVALAPMPLGTITSTSIAPFPSTVTLKSPSTTLVYSGNYQGMQQSTTLGVNGSLTATAP